MAKNDNLYKASPELVKEFEQAICDVWDSERMRKYCIDKCSTVWKCAGVIVDFDKPSIETSFCFDDSYDTEANESSQMAHYASTNESYFFEKNLDKYNNIIDALESDFASVRSSYYHTRSPYIVRGRYCSQSAENPLGAIRWLSDYEYTFEETDEEKQRLHKLTDIERLELLHIYQSEREKFAKRLRAYLKRYGLTKLHVWTYWGMA